MNNMQMMLPYKSKISTLQNAKILLKALKVSVKYPMNHCMDSQKQKLHLQAITFSQSYRDSHNSNLKLL